MTVTNYQITLAAASVNIAAALSLPISGAAAMYTKLRLQLVPGATGPFKAVAASAEAVGTNYSATGQGTFRTVSQEYVIEDQSNRNSILPGQYNVSGAHPGDILNIELHQA